MRTGASGLTVVVFTDLVGSTALLARLGDDRMQRVQATHVRDVERAVHFYGGVVHKSMGDGVMASFGSALDALAAAAEVARDVEALDAREGGLELAVRVGVSAGEPIVAGDDLHGMMVVIAARLCATAQPSEVLVQDVVRALVASRSGVSFGPSVEYALKGVGELVPAAALQWRRLAPVANELSAPAPARGAEARPNVPLPRALAGYAAEPFVGRDREATLLREALLAPGRGRRAVLVLGEPGIGKTRHAAALAEEAHARGDVVVLARCPPESVTAFEPWVRGLGELARAGDDVWRARLAEAAGGELCALVPELAGDAGPYGAPDGARYRVLRGIGDVFGASLRDGVRLLLVLDDAHWCDEGSVQVLRAVLDSPVADRLSLMVTARDRELGRRHAVTRALGELRRTRELTELKLDGLDDDGLAALLAERLGRAVTPRLVTRLRARTGGNPFFSAELAHDLEGRGALRDDAALDDAPVPDAVAGLVEARLQRLGAETEAFLVAAAAIGPHAEVALAGAAAGISPSELDAAVAEAVAERLIDEELAPAPRVAFAHALVREALLGLRTPAERARLHHAIADQLAQREDTEPGDLARHRELAAPVTGPQPAVAAHRLAADEAARAGAHEEAADHLDAALRLAGPDAGDRAELLLAVGDQRLLAADLRRGRVAYRAAADAARGSGDVMSLARAALGYAGGDIGFFAEMPQEDPFGPALLREALDALGDRDPVLALGLSLRRAFGLVFYEDPAELAALARNAERLASLAGTDEAMALGLLVGAVRLAGRSEDALAHVGRLADMFAKALAHAERSGRDDLLLRVLQMNTATAYTHADIPRVEALLGRLDEVVVRLDAPRYTSELASLRAARHADRCEFDEADRLIRAAGAALRDVRGELQIIVESQLVLMEYYRTGDASRLHSASAGMATGVDIGLWRANRVWARALTGDQGGARAELDGLLRDDFELLRRPDIHLPWGLVIAAHTAELCNHREAAPLLRPALERLRGHIGALYPALTIGLPSEFGLGLLDLLEGHHDSALLEFETALIAFDALENRLFEPWVQVYRAMALHRRGGPGDHAQAEATIGNATGKAQRLGLGALTMETARVRAELDGREPPSRGSGVAQTRPTRALQARAGRRALATLVRSQDDAALERRFSNPRRQRALLRAMAHGFQPDHARGHIGAVIAYTLEPYAIDPPLDAPWRWAIQLGDRTARLVEPAPLQADVSIQFGLADWIRIMAGLQTPVASMAVGRCRIEGDILLAIRLEAMFTG